MKWTCHALTEWFHSARAFLQHSPAIFRSLWIPREARCPGHLLFVWSTHINVSTQIETLLVLYVSEATVRSLIRANKFNVAQLEACLDWVMAQSVDEEDPSSMRLFVAAASDNYVMVRPIPLKESDPIELCQISTYRHMATLPTCDVCTIQLDHAPQNNLKMRRLV